MTPRPTGSENREGFVRRGKRKPRGGQGEGARAEERTANGHREPDQVTSRARRQDRAIRGAADRPIDVDEVPRSWYLGFMRGRVGLDTRGAESNGSMPDASTKITVIAC